MKGTVLTYGYSENDFLSHWTKNKNLEKSSFFDYYISRDLNKKFQDFNFEQQGRIIEFWFDACYLQKVNPKRDHHQNSLQLLGYVEKILRDFLLNPSNKNLLPKS